MDEALTFESFFVDIPSVPPDTTLVFYNDEGPSYRRNVALLLGSREESVSVFLRPLADETAEERLARVQKKIKEDLERGGDLQEGKYLLVSRPPTENKMLNEVIEEYFGRITPYSDISSEVFYLENPAEPAINHRKREILKAMSAGEFSRVRVTPIPSLLNMYRKMARGTLLHIFLTPSERKAINPGIFLGHNIEEFTSEQLKALKLSRLAHFLSKKPTVQKTRILKKKLEGLAIEILDSHSPESFSRLDPYGGVSVITDDAKLIPLAKGKGWYAVEVFTPNPIAGKRVAFIGSPEKLEQYREAIARFDLDDLGMVPPERILDADIVVVEKKDTPFPHSLSEEGKEIWLLDWILEASHTIKGCPALKPNPQGEQIIQNEDEEVNCDDFLTDRLYRRPAFPVPLPHPIDEKKAQEWVMAHPEKFREMARDFIRATHHVGFDEFHTNLRRSTLAALEKIGDRPFALLILAESGRTKEKSNYWVSQLIWDFFEEKKKFPAIVTDSMKNTFLEYPQIRDYIVADDASYSGSQMRNTVQRQLEKTLWSLVVRQDELTIPEKEIFFGLHEIAECDRNKIDPMFNMHVVIPYISAEAKKFITPDCRYKCYLRLFFYDQVTMLRLSEIVGRDCVRRMVKEEFIDMDKWPYYFDHKIADEVSTYPEKYGYGQVVGSTRKVVFLENCYEKGCYGSYYKSLF